MKVTQSCPTLPDPMYYTVHGIIQARILEWVALPFPRDLPNPGIKPRSPALQANYVPAEPHRNWEYGIPVSPSLTVGDRENVTKWSHHFHMSEMMPGIGRKNSGNIFLID